MIQTKKIKSLADLLGNLKNESSLVLANLCPNCHGETYLIEEVIKKVQSNCETIFNYIKLTHTAAQKIKDELMVVKSPVLLLIYEGTIKGVYSGYIGYDQLCKAIAESKDITGFKNQSNDNF